LHEQVLFPIILKKNIFNVLVVTRLRRV
jgi:hypothetical protein